MNIEPTHRMQKQAFCLFFSSFSNILMVWHTFCKKDYVKICILHHGCHYLCKRKTRVYRSICKATMNNKL